MGGLRQTTAERWLEALFADQEPIGATEIRAVACANGIREKTLRRAAKNLGIKVKRDGPPSDDGAPTWHWHPPAARRPAVLESVNVAEIAINLGLRENEARWPKITGSRGK
jgi:hypothetical protein